MSNTAKSFDNPVIRLYPFMKIIHKWIIKVIYLIEILFLM